MLEKGYIQLYTGDGKGKTTAALGLALRASGAGLKSIIIQFMKGQHYSELESIAKLKSHITIEQYGSSRFCFINDENFEEHYSLAKNAMKRAHEVIISNIFDIIILDEIVTSLYFKIITMDEIIKLIEQKPENKELVLTGRGAPQHLISLCDLVTEMTEVKHYYTNGVSARTGIEK
jgi:cob(I)alamin adenosyltransferase